VTADLAVLVPVLGRPHRVPIVLASVRAATPEADVLFVCDPDDTTTQDAVALAGARMISPGGNYAHKINTAVRATTAPLLFLAADDLDFHPGWFERAAARLNAQVHVVGVNDMCSRRVQSGTHATHFLVTREYALRPTIDGQQGPLCELYDHSFVDDELVATARYRRTIEFATDAIVQHLHPDNGLAAWDATYEKGRARMREDRKLFRARSRLWT